MNILKEDIIQFDVGGKIFKTAFKTLESQQNNFLLEISKKQHSYQQRSLARPTPIFIDRNPHYFSYILDYLRKGKINLKSKIYWLEDFLEEANYYRLDSLSKIVSQRISDLRSTTNSIALCNENKNNNKILSLIGSSSNSSSSSSSSSELFNSSLSVFSQHAKNQTPKKQSNHLTVTHSKLSPFPAATTPRRSRHIKPHNDTGLQEHTHVTLLPNQSQYPSEADTILEEESAEYIQSKHSLMNDHSTPPSGPCLPAEYNLGPQILGTDAEVF